MTTLEIVRLDSPTSLQNSSPSQSSAKFSTKQAEVANNELHDIPINILKSPSFANSLNQSQSPSNLNDSDKIDNNVLITNSDSNNQNNNTNQSSINTLSISDHSNLNKKVATTTNMSSTSSSGQFDSSENIDEAININSSTLVSDLELKSNTVRFNKYGFAQPEYSTNTLSNNGDTNSKRSSTNQNSLKNGKQINGANSVQSLTTDKSLSAYGDSNTNTSKKNGDNRQMAITNLKDYIQNTDVEEFAENLPIEVIRSRESKWIEMLSNFNEWMERRFKKIKSRCRKGIPQSMRSRAWMHLTGAYLLKNQKPNYYQDCLTNVKKLDVAKYIDDIKKDLHRQFPSHEIFMKKEGRQMLFNVLKAYAVHNKEVGYCQAQGPIAALLLMHMPEEDSFWMLVRISDYYLKGYFKPGLEKVQIDGQALFLLFKKENQVAFKLMKSQGIDPILYMTEWFMCVFARTLPWCTVLRVWDMFFCEGVKVLYRVGLHLMLSAFSDKQQFQRCQSQNSMYETLSLLKNLPVDALCETKLISESSMIKFSDDEFKKAYDKSGKEFQKQTDQLNKNRNKDQQQQQPSTKKKK